MLDSIIFNTFAVFQNIRSMKVLKVREVVKLLEKDGWVLSYWKGDHRQFKHPDKPGKVTVRGKPNEDMDQNNLNSIWKQAGWR